MTASTPNVSYVMGTLGNITPATQFGTIDGAGGSENGDTLNETYGNTINTAWFRGFPFEARYASVDRQHPTLYQSGAFLDTYVYQILGQDTTADRAIPGDAGGAYSSWGLKGILSNYAGNIVSLREQSNSAHWIFALGRRGGVLQDDPSSTSWPPLQKMAYGVGNGLYGSQTWYGDNGGSRYQRRANKIRGFKYGLVDVNPRFSSAVFRGDRYGQFRDMLEQRQHAVYEMQSTLSPSKIIPATRSTPFGPTPFQRPVVIPGKRELSKFRPVEVVFRQPVWEDPTSTSFQTLASETESSNLSTFATSSIPYYDGISTNRGAITSSADVVIV